MRHKPEAAARVALLLTTLVAATAALAGPASAAPVDGPHELVDNQLTTTQPDAPAGFHYTGRYHAAGDPAGDPPYMRRMISYSPGGMDDALQLASDISVPPLTRTVNGESRSYLTTPPTCPDAAYWETPIRFWWADGSVDTVVTRQACTSLGLSQPRRSPG